jgi:hypothetical protein
MKRSELVAIHVIETVHIHKGARAEYRSQQSAGEYDIDLRYGDGTTAAVEVTSSTIQEAQHTLAVIGKRGCSVPAIACRNSWWVSVLPEARIKLVLEKVDRYLSAIEADGLDRFLAGPGRVSPSVSKILQVLQIAHGQTIQTSPPARIWVSPSGECRGSVVKASDLQRAVEAEANKLDNRRKLAASPASQHAERHLFVYGEPLNEGPWQALVTHCLPQRPPVLPADVTHVWAVAETPHGIIVWVAEPPNGWRDLGAIPTLK